MIEQKIEEITKHIIGHGNYDLFNDIPLEIYCIEDQRQPVRLWSEHFLESKRLIIFVDKNNDSSDELISNLVYLFSKICVDAGLTLNKTRKKVLTDIMKRDFSYPIKLRAMTYALNEYKNKTKGPFLLGT